MDEFSFITPWETFCYKVMLFNLKNAGATYQRAMITLFHDMMHKEIKFYMDDMISKSKTEEGHVIHLKKLFYRLRKYRLRLNPAKCTFNIRSGKLLGFTMIQKDIEVDRDKVKSIQEMPEPRTKKSTWFLGHAELYFQIHLASDSHLWAIIQAVKKISCCQMEQWLPKSIW